MEKSPAEQIREITAIENKYGLIPFRMGLTHLVDVGFSNLTDENVEAAINKIVADAETDKANGVIQVMTPELQCELIRCAAELAKFSVWDIFAYIKENVVIGAKRQGAGTCPECGHDNLEYGSGNVEENSYVYKWKCEECCAFGREYYDLEFSEQILDGEGKQNGESS